MKQKINKTLTESFAKAWSTGQSEVSAYIYIYIYGRSYRDGDDSCCVHSSTLGVEYCLHTSGSRGARMYANHLRMQIDANEGMQFGTRWWLTNVSERSYVYMWTSFCHMQLILCPMLYTGSPAAEWASFHFTAKQRKVSKEASHNKSVTFPRKCDQDKQRGDGQ